MPGAVVLVGSTPWLAGSAQIWVAGFCWRPYRKSCPKPSFSSTMRRRGRSGRPDRRRGAIADGAAAAFPLAWPRRAAIDEVEHGFPQKADDNSIDGRIVASRAGNC